MKRLLLSLAAVAAVCQTPLRAQEVKTPYWASIRAGVVNMRAGPGEDYRISWVYRRAQLPLKVLRLMEGWRLVEDPDGAQGWILARFLTRERMAYVKGSGLAAMTDSASTAARVLWRVEPGVIVKLGDCADGWCAVSIADRIGFMQQARLWGAGEP